jgi:hypothetical protein
VQIVLLDCMILLLQHPLLSTLISFLEVLHQRVMFHVKFVVQVQNKKKLVEVQW